MTTRLMNEPSPSSIASRDLAGQDPRSRELESSTAQDKTGRNAVRSKMASRTGNGSKSESRAPSWKLVGVVAWLSFSIALAIWWMIFGLQQIDRLSALSTPTGAGETMINPELASTIARQHRMLVYEGTTLVILLLGGGGALIYYIMTEIRRAQRIQAFFAAFTHDLKTSLASLRLQAESLEEDLKDSGEGRVARRLVKDTVRLELQLENSLLLAAPDGEERLLIEPIRLGGSGGLLQSLRHQWPDLDVTIDGEATVLADSRGLESIFKNVFQNAVVHGKASRMMIDVTLAEGRLISIRVEDDGRGFKGDKARLGRMFHRHATSSGSGLGLYLAMGLARRMGGVLRIIDPSSSSGGFAIELLMPAALGDSETKISNEGLK